MTGVAGEGRTKRLTGLETVSNSFKVCRAGIKTSPKGVGVFIKVKIKVLFLCFSFQEILKHDPWDGL